MSSSSHVLALTHGNVDQITTTLKLDDIVSVSTLWPPAYRSSPLLADTYALQAKLFHIPDSCLNFVP